MRRLLLLPMLVLALPLTAPNVAQAHSCAAGYVHAVIGGSHKCLRKGQACKKTADTQYHLAGFHCHSTGKLTYTPLRQQLVSTTSLLATRTAERDAAITERNQALAGLPDAILAVPLVDMRTTVFDPARTRWTCDSFYNSEGYWSYTFDSLNFC